MPTCFLLSCDDERRTEGSREGVQHRSILLGVLNLRGLEQTGHMWRYSQESRRKIRIVLNATEKLLNH
jgi:hypothetical protein